MWKRPYLSGLLYRGIEIFLKWAPFCRQRLMNLQNFLKKRSLFVPMDDWIDLRSSTTLGTAKLWVKPLVFVLPISIHWIENVWPDIIRNYDEKDIFNAD
ncbi:hypothetical protein AVEN_102769-1 [Araneus ventricosus]|uniref:Uncharacterized protein n=1 Tax=Araneus ventricosus TaxID=182803 RepID=A0A4Y2VFP4_ARAVE|nr:hypothetical protein AVEN_102769-1 [Araneus ventricosus]